MSQAPLPEPKRRAGRPQSQAARQTILAVAYRILMEEGLGRLSIERVAAEAGVGKPTIYRSWANAQELAMAAFLAGPQVEFEQPRSRSLRRSLAAHLCAVVSAFATVRGRQITLTMASADPESELAKAFRNQILFKSREVGRQLLANGVAAGEFAAIEDVDVVLDLLYGPLFYRLLAGHQPLTLAFAEKVVQTVVEGLAV